MIAYLWKHFYTVKYANKIGLTIKAWNYWTIGKTLTVPNWNTDKECGEGKFHACAKPRWCDIFRSEKGDRYIKIKVNINEKK